LTTAVAVLMSWVAVRRREAASERLAAEELQREWNVSVHRDGFYKPGWLARLLGRDFCPVRGVWLDEFPQSDLTRAWALLAAFPSLEELHIQGGGDADEFFDVLERRPNTCIYVGRLFHHPPRDPELRLDATLTSSKRAIIERLLELRSLSICLIRVDDVAFLRGLKKLDELDLSRTGVGDGVFQAVHGCTHLSRLSLAYDDITDADLTKLRSLPNLTYLNLDYTFVTDAGLKTLEGLKSLKWLQVEGTAVAKKAIDEIERALPGLNVVSNLNRPDRPVARTGSTSQATPTTDDGAKGSKQQQPQGPMGGMRARAPATAWWGPA
jgi:hypothetical protein